MEVLDVDAMANWTSLRRFLYPAKWKFYTGTHRSFPLSVRNFASASKPSVFVTGNFNGDGGPDLCFSVAPVAPTFTFYPNFEGDEFYYLSSSLNPTNLAQEITLTATVTSSFGIPSGSVHSRMAQRCLELQLWMR